MSPVPVTPATVATRASRRMDRDLSEWLLGTADDLGIPLHPPTGKQAAADISAASRFIREWQAYPAAEDTEVVWAERSWHAAALGTQPVPVRLIARGATAIAATAGRLPEWHELQRRFGLLVDARSPEVRAVAAARVRDWRDLDDVELVRVHELTRWFVANPASGLLPRAVAVEGIHGKWLEKHRGFVAALVSAARGQPDGSLGELGLSDVAPVIRLRRLDPQLRGSEGIQDIAVPVPDAAALFPRGPQPQVVLMVENLATFLALPATSPGGGAVVVWTKGYAVDLVAQLPWLSRARLLYWGDLDSDGFAILHQLRSALAADTPVESVLMDTATVGRFAHLGVPDPGDVGRVLARLNPAEQQARDKLVASGRLRIEQERVNWGYALDQLSAAGFPVD